MKTAILIAPNAGDVSTVLLNAGTFNTVGSISVGAVGSGVLVVNNGNIIQTNTGFGLRVGGNNNTQGSNTSGTGILYFNGGGIAMTGDVYIGWAGTGGGGVGTFYQTAGTMTVNAGRNFNVGMGGLGSGTYNLLGGSVTNSGTTWLGNGGAGGGTAAFNMNGGVFNAGVFNANGTASTSAINLNGGTLRINALTLNATANANVSVNFNGGTLQAGASSTNFLGGLAAGRALIYSGGAIIDSQANSISINENLQNAVGSGISSVAVTPGPESFVTPPIVTFSGGGGVTTPASGYATLDNNGLVTGIVVTNPGQYADPSGVTATIAGSTSALTPVSTLNNLGGLTKQGSGILTLNGTNTYAGPTLVLAGTLDAATSASLLTGTSNVSVASGATIALGVGGVSGFTNAQIDALLSSGNVSNGASLGLDTTGGNYSYTNDLGAYGSASFGLVKLGANTLTLSPPGNASTFNGPVTIFAGTLNAPTDAALGNGTALTFAGSGTFQFGGSYTTAASRALTALTGVNTTIDTGTNAAGFGSAFTGGNNFTKIGAGSLALTGANSIAGTFSVNTGKALFSSGATLTSNNMIIGGAGGSGALYQNGGAITVTQAVNVQDFRLGAGTGTYGYYGLSGNGTLNANQIGVGSSNGSGNTGNGLFEVFSGTVNIGTGILGVGQGTGQLGVVNLYGGTIIAGTSTASLASGVYLNTGGGSSGAGNISVVNVLGGFLNAASGTSALNQGGGSGNVGIMNLNGGTFSTYRLTSGNGVTSKAPTYLNFNGGTFKASVTQNNLISNTINAYVNAGGGTIDDGGFAITVPVALLGPTGNGVSTSGVSLAGLGLTGLIAPPIVTVTRAGGDTNGVDATAIANFDPTTGNVTGITVTNAGVNFLTGSAPVFTLSGGGLTNTVTFTGTVAANLNTGILIKNGLGTTTLSGANTFAGGLIINSGTVIANSPAGTFPAAVAANALGAGTVVVNAGAVLRFQNNNNYGNGAANVIPPTIFVNGGTLDTVNFDPVANVVLNGGTMSSSGGSTAAFQSYTLNGTISTVPSTVTSIVSSGTQANTGYHLSPQTAFTVAAGSTATGVDLLVSALLLNDSGDAGSVAGKLTKNGPGFMVLSNPGNTYSGGTIINGGTLSVIGGSLALARVWSPSTPARCCTMHR